MLKVGDKLPAGQLQEFVEVEGNGCSIGPNTFPLDKLTAGKKIAVFGLPGAFTPTCSAKHVPGYVENAAALNYLPVALGGTTPELVAGGLLHLTLVVHIGTARSRATQQRKLDLERFQAIKADTSTLAAEGRARRLTDT